MRREGKKNGGERYEGGMEKGSCIGK